METKPDKTLEILFELKVKDVMRTEVIFLPPETTMIQLRKTLKEHGIAGLPVVRDEKLIGIVSIEDLIRWLVDGGEPSTVGERMTKNPQCLYPDQQLALVVRKFEKSGYGRFPVVDRNTKKLLGIVTKGDIIEGALKKLQTEYREEEIRQYRASHIFVDVVADNKEIFLKYNVTSRDFDNAGKASTTVKKNLKRLGIKPDIIHRIAIASYEAEINLVIYSDNGGTMTYSIDNEKIYLEVKDDGPGIEDIGMAMQPGFTTSPPWVKELGFGAGMGLDNIKKCSDNMEIVSAMGTGTTLKVTFYTGVNGDEDK